jgi:hypothetical protein
MFSWLANAWRVPELRKRVLFTFMILAFYRLGSWIPAPGVDSQTIKDYFNGRGGTILGLLNVFSGGALSQFALFALGIMPYITASIILQLMTVVVPKLEQLQKEGESGYAKINQYTRYLTVALAAAQSTGYAYLFKRAGNLDANTGRIILIVVTLTAGTTLHLPVYVPGALFSAGDCHAAQGDGEVCVTGIECPMRFSLRFTVLKGRTLPPWRYEFVTPPGALQLRSDAAGYYVHSALGPDLMTNAKNAVRGVIDWLVREKDLTREDAYVLCSLAVDLKISQIVDAPNWGVSAYLALSVFTR